MFTRVQASAWTDDQTINNSLEELLLLAKLLLGVSLLVAAKLLLGELLEAAKLLGVGTLLGKLGDTSLGTVHGSGTKLLEALAEAAELLTVAAELLAVAEPRTVATVAVAGVA